MDAETSPTSRVVAAVPAGGATWATIRRDTGLSAIACDSGLHGAIRSRLLHQVNGVYYPSHCIPRDQDDEAKLAPVARAESKRVARIRKPCERKPKVVLTERVCRVCGVLHGIVEFHYQGLRKDGSQRMSRVCRLCARAARRFKRTGCVNKRADRRELFATLIRRWKAGERIVGEDMRQARKWWARNGRPEL